MLSRDFPLCSLALLGVAMIATPGAKAQLATKSPFLPATAAAGAAPTAGASLEFRAILEASGERQFRVYDPARKAGVWVKLNERDADFDVTAKEFENSEQGKLTVEHQGKRVTLPLRQAKVVSSGAAAQAMPPAPVASNVPPAVTQAVVLNPTPADEQRRLDAVAAEVQRRRALREQAAQQVIPATNVPVPMPLPIQQPGNYQPGTQRIAPPLTNPGGQRIPVPAQPGGQSR